LIGMGSTILNGAHIGRGSIIGANALIPEGKLIPPHSMVLGVPGRVVRELGVDTLAEIERLAAGYVGNASKFASEMTTVDKASKTL